MEKVDFTFKRGGRTKPVSEKQARAFAKIGLGTYQTRDMAFQHGVQKPMVADRSVDDGLDALDKEQLHALAKDRGLTLHHALGAEKVRAAIRGQAS